MFNEAEYQTLWMVYLAAAACCWLVWTQLTRWIGWWFVREPLWVIMAVILFTPAQVDPLKPELAPAAIGWLLDFVLGSGGDTGVLLSQLVAVAAGAGDDAGGTGLCRLCLSAAGLALPAWQWRQICRLILIPTLRSSART